MTDFQQHYQQFYGSGNLDEWRRIGAVGKAANVVRGWAEVTISPHRPVVIELSCGDGAIAQQLHELEYFSRYQGFDISGSGIQVARARNIPNATFTTVTASIPVEDDAADVVIMSHVIEHLEHPRQLIEEAHRIAPLLIVEVPCELNRRLPPEYDWDPVGHINHYNPASIRALLQTCRYDFAGQFTTNPSREVQTFQQPGWKSTAKWAVKDLALRAAPKLATTQFTYHETLMAWRNNGTFTQRRRLSMTERVTFSCSRPGRTSVGLDVHARSVAAAAIDGVTGEVVQTRLTPSREHLPSWISELPGGRLRGRSVRSAIDAQRSTGSGLGVGGGVRVVGVVPATINAGYSKSDDWWIVASQYRCAWNSESLGIYVRRVLRNHGQRECKVQYRKNVALPGKDGLPKSCMTRSRVLPGGIT